ncbi:hypothetical protein R9C00_05385 [Flammeovirgaceae bacterium SG7u.111]|nr:hypothetical protein [Flammeovirgaceae bacterium SG7u.132]WPO36873.1 hypothetical protein R9C00_05385 [Flammeovirgaceae bacterium SG7u.111]
MVAYKCYRAMGLFKKKYNIDYSILISELEKGDKGVVQNLLWQPKNKTINYFPITTKLIQKLEKSENSIDKLVIHKKIEKGRFELIIFEIPWAKSDIPYSSIIIDKSNSKIAGIILPFNELHGHLSTKENKMIGDLGKEWTEFVMKYRFKI